MANRLYVLSLLHAVYSRDQVTLNRLFSMNGDDYVSGMYLLYVNGLVLTRYGNFIPGGDDPMPIDVNDKFAFSVTPFGASLLQKQL